MKTLPMNHGGSEISKFLSKDAQVDVKFVIMIKKINAQFGKCLKLIGWIPVLLLMDGTFSKD